MRKGIDATKSFLGQLTQGNIFPISQKSVSENFAKNSRYSHIDFDKCSRYTGKIFTDKEIRNTKLYNDYFIIFSLGYLFDKTEKGEKVRIRNGATISQVANGEQDVKGCMTIEEEKEYILALARKYFPERIKDLEIVDMEEQEENKSLFTSLRAQGISALDSKGQQPQLSQEADSLDIAKYLYRVCQNNKLFKKRIAKLVPEDKVKKTVNNFPEYYGLIEIACRLNDFLDGTLYQGGTERQNIYDEVIKVILGTQGNLDKYPELGGLRAFCQSKMQDTDINRIYIHKKIYKESLATLTKQKRRTLDISKIAGAASLALFLVFGGYQYANYKQEADFKKQETEILKKNLQDKKVITGFHYNYNNIENINRKLEALASATENISSIVKDIYGVGNVTDKEIIALIEDDLSQGDNLNNVLLDMDNYYYHSIKFIKDIFVPNNKLILHARGFNTLPYADFQPHKDAFENTLKITGELQLWYAESPYNLNVTKNTTTQMSDKDINSVSTNSQGWEQGGAECKILGTYTIPNYGVEHTVLLIEAMIEGQKTPLILATDGFSYEPHKPNKFTLENGQEVAEDFLKNRTDKASTQ